LIFPCPYLSLGYICNILHGKFLIHSNFLETIICFCLHKTSHQYCRVQFGVHCSHMFLSTIVSLESYKSKSPTLEINENMHTQHVQRRKVSYIARKSKYASPKYCNPAQWNKFNHCNAFCKLLHNYLTMLYLTFI
jgi:hypothetical protein